MALRGTTINPTLSEDATTETEAERKKREKAKKTTKKSTGQAAGEGAISGAAAGTAISPGLGTIIGAGIGAGAGLVDANRADKATPAGRPERRRLTAALGKVDERKKNRKMALATLSQAVFDWAAAIR
jgi:hypothetical protein